MKNKKLEAEIEQIWKDVVKIMNRTCKKGIKQFKKEDRKK